MDPDFMEQHFDFERKKTNWTYNGAKLRITEIKRKDGEMLKRKTMKKICDTFLNELREQYPNAHGLVSVSIKYSNRWYSGNVSSFEEPINYFNP